MKLITGIVASLVIGSLSFGAFAAKEIQKMKWVNEADENRQHYDLKTTSPMDAKRDLSKKADELGGKYFVVIAGSKTRKPFTLTPTSQISKSGSQDPLWFYCSEAYCSTISVAPTTLASRLFPQGNFAAAGQTAVRVFRYAHGFPHGFQTTQHGLDQRRGACR